MTERFKRKLTTIFNADVEGYSRLMGEDEAQTVKTLTTYREIIAELIEQHRGRVVDSPGDNVLAEFTSVVDAVQCAVGVQKELQARNAELPEGRRMEFRIGINLGDVIEEGDRIYGDGVNIAARLEGLAEPGGICVSKTAFDQIETKLPLGYEYLGEQTVKNIPKPVGAYRVLMEPRVTVVEAGEERKVWPVRRKAIITGAATVLVLAIAVGIWHFYLRPAPPVEVASVEKMASPLPDKPSIAVLPFVNMSGDPAQEYFTDGLTEEIITAISKTPRLFVIARNSSFVYKDKLVKIQRVAEELGVRYVLEGSVRKSEDRVRITAQLIDAITGKHLWAERYERNLKDIFALQDEITFKILNALEVKLAAGDEARVWAKGTDNLEAYLKYLQGREHLLRFNKESNVLARQRFEETIALDQEYALAYRGLATTHMMDVWLKTSKSAKQSIAQAIELAKKAIALDESEASAYGLLGFLFTMVRQHEKGIAEAEKAVGLNPNSAVAHHYLGLALRFGGRPGEAIPVIKKAIRLDPFAPSNYLYNLGLAYLFAGQYEEAIRECKKATDREPNNLGAYLALTGVYSLSGREAEARATAEEVLRINPKFSLEYFAKTLAYKNQTDKERFIDALRKAGLK